MVEFILESIDSFCNPGIISSSLSERFDMTKEKLVTENRILKP